MSKRARSFRHRPPHTALARLNRAPRRRVGIWDATLVQQKRALKRATFRDCANRCVYCGIRLDFADATLDHVYPIARGGQNVAGNVVAACGPCNRRKGDMLPQEFFYRFPIAGLNFLSYARVVHRALKRGARRAVSLAMAAEVLPRAA